MEIKLNKIKKMRVEEMQSVKQGAKLCVDMLIQEEYSLLKDKSVLKEILSNNFDYLSWKLFFEKETEDKSTIYIYILSCWVNEISKLDMNYETFNDKLKSILGINKELPYIIEDAFKYIESKESIDNLNYMSNKIYEYNTNLIDIRMLIKNPNTPEIKVLEKEICIAIHNYGKNHISLNVSKDKKYNLIYHSPQNSFCITEEPYLLKGIPEHEIKISCEKYDIELEEE